ncbi:hypothetical protein AVEN_167896-1 [Araneus ventricosus]|uniref:Uncharacterized protein n=1 Tax=Araneus ventricosus TaxID=182803 RepID=A0A4Y2IUJ8_ARAVE|nr:hypothetical protein AVEN_167896-1 [Araneus ventricosus]
MSSFQFPLMRSLIICKDCENSYHWKLDTMRIVRRSSLVDILLDYPPGTPRVRKGTSSSHLSLLDASNLAIGQPNYSPNHID